MNNKKFLTIIKLQLLSLPITLLLMWYFNNVYFGLLSPAFCFLMTFYIFYDGRKVRRRKMYISEGLHELWDNPEDERWNDE